MQPIILANKLICDDGTILHSTYRWDYVSYTDANGKEYTLDGGNDYVRTNGEGKLLTITTEDDHSLIREHFQWTRNLDENRNRLPEPEVILLKDITDSHLEALIEWTDPDEKYYPKYINQLFVDEKEWRMDNELL